MLEKQTVYPLRDFGVIIKQSCISKPSFSSSYYVNSLTNSNLLFMLDARKDPAAIRRVYEQLVAEGVELDDSFLQQYNQILLKYTDTASSEVRI